MNFEIGAVGSSGGYGTGFLECASDMVFALERRVQSKKVRQVPVIRYGGGKRWEPAEKKRGYLQRPWWRCGKLLLSSKLAVPFLSLKKGTSKNCV